MDNSSLYSVKEILCTDTVDSLLNLQERIFKSLQENGHGDYILPKTREDYEKIINDSKLSVIGIFNENNKLIGQLVVKESSHEASQNNGLYLRKKLYEIANVLIDPEYNGKGLAKQMISFVKGMKKYSNATLTAEIEITNLASIKTFLGSDFVIVNTEKSPIDGAEIYILAFNRNLNKQISNVESVEVLQNLQYEDYEELTSAGLITVGYTKSQLRDDLIADVFIMKKSKYLLNEEENVLSSVKNFNFMNTLIAKRNYHAKKIWQSRLRARIKENSNSIRK
mgnify:CR=1 FL=1